MGLQNREWKGLVCSTLFTDRWDRWGRGGGCWKGTPKHAHSPAVAPFPPQSHSRVFKKRGEQLNMLYWVMKEQLASIESVPLWLTFKLSCRGEGSDLWYNMRQPMPALPNPSYSPFSKIYMGHLAVIAMYSELPTGWELAEHWFAEQGVCWHGYVRNMERRHLWAP